MDHEFIASMKELRPSEQRLISAMRQLGYGRFESLQIQRGELVLDPWPTTIRSVKFGGATTNRPDGPVAEFQPKKQITDLFALVRSLDSGMIRSLEVRGGLPFSMELDEPG